MRKVLPMLLGHENRFYSINRRRHPETGQLEIKCFQEWLRIFQFVPSNLIAKIHERRERLIDLINLIMVKTEFVTGQASIAPKLIYNKNQNHTLTKILLPKLCYQKFAGTCLDLSSPDTSLIHSQGIPNAKWRETDVTC